ncbi:hypothetical protein F0U60_01945 [Archangium minus]|uniref:Uncharacterized protein n=1 Tax=Archangium minus TaxID=83450 RepID=A0ABY9WGR6_9BACT|nr:hypothetical protein F0U60_01945 [Archangium minus]
MSLLSLPCLLSSALPGQSEPPAPASSSVLESLVLNLASLGVSLEPEPVDLRALVGIGTAMEVVHGAEAFF